MTEHSEPRSNEAPENTTDQGTANGSLRGAFPDHFRPTAEEFGQLWEEGIFVVDTNVLLNLYRYSHSTRDELLRVLLALKDKLFLPHQVAQEFLDQRLTTVRTQREKVSKLRERVTGIHAEMEKELRKVLRLRSGEGLPAGLRDALQEVPPSGYEALSERLESLEKELPRTSNTPDDDAVWTAIEGLVDGKVGPAYQDEDMRKAEEEAERRRKADVPPGFKDERPGDYVLWRQTIDEAKRSGRPVVLVTDDRKDDWWWKEQGETIGPRRELVVEMRKEAGTLFYMYTPDRLMGEARERLDVEVSNESISEAEGLGRDAGDDETSEAKRLRSYVDELYGTLHSLSDSEKLALGAFTVHADTDRVAEALGSSRAAASSLLDRALSKLQNELAHRDPHDRTWSDHAMKNVRRSLARQNTPITRTEPRISSFSVTLQSDENSISGFTRSLLERYPQIETIDRRFAGEAFGDVTLEIRFRPPVPVDYAVEALEDTAAETGVVLSTMTYNHSVS